MVATAQLCNLSRNIQPSIKDLLALHSHVTWKHEVVVYIKSVQKLAVRLRTVKAVRLLLQIRQLIKRAEFKNVWKLLADPIWSEETYNTATGSIELPTVSSVLNILNALTEVQVLFERVVHLSKFACGYTLPWLRLGQMTPFFLTAVAALCRMSVMTKALLVYVDDVKRNLQKIKLLSENKVDSAPSRSCHLQNVVKAQKRIMNSSSEVKTTKKKKKIKT